MSKSGRGLLLFVVAIIGWFAIVRPQTKVFGERMLTATAKKVEVESYQQRISDIDTIRSSGEAVQRILTAQYLALPKTAQIPEALVMIESLANSAGVTLSSANIGTPSETEVPVGLAFTGSLANVTTFLDALYNNVRTAVIKDQSLTSDKNGTITVTVQLGLVYQGGR